MTDDDDGPLLVFDELIEYYNADIDRLPNSNATSQTNQQVQTMEDSPHKKEQDSSVQLSERQCPKGIMVDSIQSAVMCTWNDLKDNSELFKDHDSEDLPAFDFENLFETDGPHRSNRKGYSQLSQDESFTIGAILSQGGFSSVGEITENHNLAIKFMATEIIESADQFPVAVERMIREAHFLAKLQHAYIPQLHGVELTMENMAQSYLILGRVQTPLAVQMTSWDTATHWNNLIADRLKIAMQIANALTYLHSKRVVYRGLNSETIWIDRNGEVKLLDFGYAKELKGPPSKNGKYKLTQKTGSCWRYMAKEVAKGWMYNEKVDVYSFAILLWEILSASSAFEEFTLAQFTNLVVDGEHRPPMTRGQWPCELEDVMRDCWTSWNGNNRPSFDQIEERLATLYIKQTRKREERPTSSEILRQREPFWSKLKNVALTVTVFGFDAYNPRPRRESNQSMESDDYSIDSPKDETQAPITR